MSHPSGTCRVPPAHFAILALMCAGSVAFGAAQGGTPPSPGAMAASAAAASEVANPPARWPTFRGPGAVGVADGQGLPDRWDLAAGTHIRWRVPLAGLAHSSPIVWGDRLYLTTAVSSRPGATFRRGLYGDGTASDDLSPHKWIVMAIDARTGKTVWERVAVEGPPREKRHIKATYANATPATDGEVVVAFFGSQGLYAYDTSGRLLWKRDLGRLDAGAYNDRTYEWGTASSPIIWRDRVIVQCDMQQGSFLEAFDLRSGRSLWKTLRHELPSWATPTVIEGPAGPELVTNAPNAVRGYDPLSGRELWTLGGSSKITAPTPFQTDGLVIVASGRAPERPIFAIRPGARGDVTPRDGGTTSDGVAWSRTQRGSYMPTPLAYRGLLYVLGNQGLFDCYDLKTGAEVYRQRLPHQGSGFSASPVAADGVIYLPGEDGDVFTVRAGATFELLASSSIGEPIMATPAIASATLFIRGERHLIAVSSRR